MVSVGRAYELLKIERWLLQKRLVVIHGFGGNGKIALVREAADWLTRTKMYDGACFISFEHGGDATTLLSTLGNFMGVNDGNYNPQVEGFTVPFLRFHPILTPFLRSQSRADDTALRKRYVQRYSELANYLYREDIGHSQAVRALVRKELANLRWAFELLLEMGDLDTASVMSDRIATFLKDIGLWRERDELQRRVAEIIAMAHAHIAEALTWTEYLRESSFGEDEFRKGNLSVAYNRFNSMLARIEALPEGTRLGRGSYQHCLTLARLARCFKEGGQRIAAEERLRKALTIIEVLNRQQPDDQDFLRQRGVLLTDLGNVLRDQGQYSQARDAYESALQVDKQLGDLKSQAVDLGQLGRLALEQRESTQAYSHVIAALKINTALGDLAGQAINWHLLGRIADEQQEWIEAERCYRESLALNEQLGDVVNAIMSCNQLAIVAEGTGRPSEAEGWYKRALELIERVHPASPIKATILSNLANLLLNEVQIGRSSNPMMRLAEAQGYAERALAIQETLDALSGIWTTLSILAKIAKLEGQDEEAHDYRRRERETYAAFAGNRYHIDRQHGQLIADIAAAAKGEVQAREKVEAALPKFEENGWHISVATKPIWSGERDWHSLAEDLDRQDALLILRVLETIEQPTETQDKTPEQVIASLPNSMREALQSGDEAAFKQAFASLSPEEQQTVGEALTYLQALQEQEKVEDEPEEGNVIQQLEPLLQAIAVVALGNTSQQSEIEEVLDELEKQDCYIKNAVHRIWAGERNSKALTTGLDEIDSALVERILEIIAEPEK